MQIETHPSYEAAKSYVTSLGYEVIEDEPKWDSQCGKMFAMISVPLNKALYKGSQFNYGNQRFFVEWARNVYRENNPR